MNLRMTHITGPVVLCSSDLGLKKDCSQVRKGLTSDLSAAPRFWMKLERRRFSTSTFQACGGLERNAVQRFSAFRAYLGAPVVDVVLLACSPCKTGMAGDRASGSVPSELLPEPQAGLYSSFSSSDRPSPPVAYVAVRYGTIQVARSPSFRG